MSPGIGRGKRGASDETGRREVKVLLLERDGATRAVVKALLENFAVGVVSARSSGRALELCSTPHLRFDALVLGPSLLEAKLDSFLGRVLSLQPALRVLVLTSADLDPAGGSALTPLSVCWALERIGCEYSLLDDPWTGPRLHLYLQELLGARLRTGALEACREAPAQDRFPEGDRCPSSLRRRPRSGSRSAAAKRGDADGTAG